MAQVSHRSQSGKRLADAVVLVVGSRPASRLREVEFRLCC